MNRIILIGNGFDLAHDMPTRYQDFLNDFWKKTTTAICNHGWFVSTPYKDDYISLNGFPEDLSVDSDYSTLKKCVGNSKVKIKFKNLFLKFISENSSLHSWVDLEDEYYSDLKDIMDDKSIFTIDELNQDFEQIKRL